MYRERDMLYINTYPYLHLYPDLHLYLRIQFLS